MTRRATDDAGRATPACPICGRPAQERFAPFCSARCADVDLANWLGGRYAIPADDDAPPDLPGQDGER